MYIRGVAEEEFVIISLTGWGLLFYGGYKFFTGGKKDKEELARVLAVITSASVTCVSWGLMLLAVITSAFGTCVSWVWDVYRKITRYNHSSDA
ncbi:conserved hypothetical protein [Ricinus communis]|uniref:Uncharacterized protein n=1 Tax=Ricinus communis TaxID=3988 RepID=B9T638_RICCO|nr:conserved hypothetical protein [Ricinus communis]